MKISRVKISNFILLQEIELEFSVDEEKNVTLIRGENDSGKSTIMRALKWAFFGDREINSEKISLRHNMSPDEVITTKVEIDYFIEDIDPMDKIHKKQFKLVRDRKSDQNISNLTIYELLDPAGYDELSNPELILSTHVVKEVEDLYFIDGDKALNYIDAERESSPAKRRENVKEAIRNMLGIEVVEELRDRVKEVKKTASGKTAKAVNKELINQLKIIADEAEEKHSESNETVVTLGTEQKNLKDKLKKFNDAYEEALKNTKDPMEEKRKYLISQQDQSLKNVEKNQIALRDLIESSKSYIPLIQSDIEDGFAVLQKLKDKGAVPKKMIPVLEEVLSGGVCICGESLHGNTDRKKHIEELIESNQKADKRSEALTDLYHETRINLANYQNFNSERKDEFDALYAANRSEKDNIDKKGAEIRNLEEKLDALPTVNVAGIKRNKLEIETKLEENLRETNRTMLYAGRIKKEAEDAIKTYQSALSDEKKADAFKGEIALIDDSLAILEEVLTNLQTSELSNLSDIMNDLFISNFGSTQILDKAYISDDFEIIIESSNGDKIDIQNSLNGANRRTLTLSFVLALMEVSSLDAPNFVDTPFGMMDIQIKNRALKLLADQNSQVILFVTTSEIRDLENKLDDYAGKYYTITNTAHHPELLKYQTDDGGISHSIVCTCGHRQFCNICELKDVNLVI